MPGRNKQKPNKRLLLFAAQAGNTFIISTFLGRSGVDPNLRTGHMQTALSLTAKNGHGEIVEMLLSQHEADVNSKD